MANYYVWSAASGAGTGADWANAFTTMTLAIAGKAAGDVFFVAHDHAETSSSPVTITFPGTEASPNRVLCVDRAGSVPPVSADLRNTGSIASTSTSALSFGGTFEMRGLTLSSGSGAVNTSIIIGNTSNRSCRLVNCKLVLATTSSIGRFNLGVTGALAILENVTMQFGSVSQAIEPHGRGFWRNTPNAIVGAIIPNAVFQPGSSQGHRWLVEGVDLSAVTGGKAIVQPGSGITNVHNLIFKDCKLASTAVTVNGAFGPAMGGQEVTIVRTDGGDTNYRLEHWSYLGQQLTETTIVRAGGASDGTTTIAWKINTTANSEWGWPFESLPITFWNDTIGSPITVTVEGIWGGGVTPLNDEIWITVYYLGTSGFPLASKAHCGKADELATGISLPPGSGTWGGSTTEFAMSVTFTPQEKGPVTIYVDAAKPSSTFYIDPKPVVT